MSTFESFFLKKCAHEKFVHTKAKMTPRVLKKCTWGQMFKKKSPRYTVLHTMHTNALSGIFRLFFAFDP